MEVTRFEVGKKFPIQSIIDGFNGSSGASLSYDGEDKSLALYAGLADTTNSEAMNFRDGSIRFWTIYNGSLDTYLLMVQFVRRGRFLDFELIYDINAVDKKYSGEVKSNAFHMFLIDSLTGELKAMRSLGLGPRFMKMINRITRNDDRYTSEEYAMWIQDIYSSSLTENISKADPIRWDE